MLLLSKICVGIFLLSIANHEFFVASQFYPFPYQSGAVNSPLIRLDTVGIRKNFFILKFLILP